MAWHVLIGTFDVQRINDVATSEWSDLCGGSGHVVVSGGV